MRWLGLLMASAFALPGFAHADPQAENWAGCYGGVSGGYAFTGRSTKSNIVSIGGQKFVAQSNNTDLKGPLGGAELGCNIQSNAFVISPEIGVWYQDVKGTSDVDNLLSPGETLHSQARSSYAATASVRLGYSIGRLLFYGKGGFALTTFRHSGYIIDNATKVQVDTITNGSRASLGYVAGGGGELALSRHLSAKLEYNYLDFGRATTPYAISLDSNLPNPRVLPGSSISREHEQVVRAGFNYRF